MKPLTDRTIAFLGNPHSDHRESLHQMVTGLGAKFVTLPDSYVSGVYKYARLPLVSKLYRAYSQWRGVPYGPYLRNILAAIDENHVDVVVAYWGTNPLADAIAVKRHRPRTAVVLNVLCHPQALSSRGIAITNRLFRHSAAYLDGYIFPGSQMEEYFREWVFLSSRPPSVVIPPCWPESMHATRHLPPCPDEPAILFMGRMDPSGQRSDDVSELLYQLMDAGVYVYHAEAPHPMRPHPNQRPFSYRPLTKVIEFATQFPASLVAYNTTELERVDRFRLTIPDRLLTSVAAGIPVALPAKGYDASLDYLREYGAVILFETATELADRLRDRSEIDRLRLLARERRALYRAEAHNPKFASFLNSLLNQTAVGRGKNRDPIP